MSTRARRMAVGLAVWSVVFAFTYAVFLTRRLDRTDEVWALWVAQRLAHGDRLYRDVYDVTTPLPSWLLGLAVWVAGAHLTVLRFVGAGVFALEVVVALSVARACGLGRRANAVLAAALFAFGSPVVAFVSLYTAIAVLGALVALRGMLWWFAARDDTVERALVMTGAGVALAFWSKPNIGVYAGIAAVGAIVAGCLPERRARIARDIAVTATSFVAVGVAFVVALLASGTWSAFVDQVFLSKGQYVEVGFSYFSAVNDRLDFLRQGGAHADLHSVVQLVVSLLPLAIVVALALVVWRSRRSSDHRAVALTAFAVAGLLGVFPRPGVNHVAGVVPLALTATVGAWRVGWPWAGSRVLRRSIAAGTAVAVALCAVVVAVDAAQPALRGDRLRSEPFWPAPLGGDREKPVRALRADLRRRGIDRVFIAREDAGYFYLLTGTRDPLPYDIVERSDLGASGERGLIRRIRRGEATWVCLHPPRPPGKRHDPLIPRTFNHWVRRTLEPVAHLPSCDLYRATAGNRTGPRA